MGPTACTEPQCLYKGDLYLLLPKQLSRPLSEFRDCAFSCILLAISDVYLCLKTELTIFLRHCKVHGKLQCIYPHERYKIDIFSIPFFFLLSFLLRRHHLLTLHGIISTVDEASVSNLTQIKTK